MRDERTDFICPHEKRVDFIRLCRTGVEFVNYGVVGAYPGNERTTKIGRVSPATAKTGRFHLPLQKRADFICPYIVMYGINCA